MQVFLFGSTVNFPFLFPAALFFAPVYLLLCPKGRGSYRSPSFQDRKLTREGVLYHQSRYLTHPDMCAIGK